MERSRAISSPSSFSPSSQGGAVLLEHTGLALRIRTEILGWVMMEM
ncbi:hypothetical protein [Rhizobium sp. NLR22b]|nr:hypothetical protein [Rhizobium sp. NLR22b]MBX5240519.1 hypothetical protein [Rhizobium sp. NLR22b]